jgi:hypothetical protein
VAEWLCRTSDRHTAPRVPGSNTHLRRGAPAASSFRLCGVLQSSAHPLGIRERCAFASSGPTTWRHCHHFHPGWTAPPIRPDIDFRKGQQIPRLSLDHRCSGSLRVWNVTRASSSCARTSRHDATGCHLRASRTPLPSRPRPRPCSECRFSFCWRFPVSQIKCLALSIRFPVFFLREFRPRSIVGVGELRPQGVALGASFMARLTQQNLAECTPWSCAFSTFGSPLSL